MTKRHIMETGPQVGGLGCLTPSQTVSKLWTHNLVCRPMHVSDWPNMVPRPNLVSDSIFLHQGPLD